MATLNSFEDLKCWRSCRRFRLFVHGLVKRFPKEEQFLMTAQLKDSSRSTTHNIAEGFGRSNALDNARFCKVSRGSLMEAMDQLITCHDEGLIIDLELQEGRALFIDARAWLEGYIEYLIQGKGGNTLREPAAVYASDGHAAGDHLADLSNPQPSTFNPQPALG